MEQTQLDKTRPDSKQHIDFTELGGYQWLLKNIELHRYLMRKASDDERAVSLPDAAADWYDNVYLPLIEVVRQRDVIKHFPGRSETDLYEWLISHQVELREQHNLGNIKMPNAVQEFLESVDS